MKRPRLRRTTVVLPVVCAIAVPVAAVRALGVGDDAASVEFDRNDLSDPLPNLSVHARGTLVPTGDSLFVYGGYTDADVSVEIPFSNSAALVDPATGLGQVLPRPPVEGALHPRGTGAFLLDDSIYLVGGICNDLFPYDGDPNIEECPLDEAATLEFDLDSGEWTRVDPPPPLVESPSAAVKLSEVSASGVPVAVIDDSTSLNTWATFWRADEQVERWSQIPPPGRRPLGYCTVGDSVAVLQADFRLDEQILEDDPTLTEEGRGTSITGGETAGDGWVDAYVTTFSLSEPEEGWVDSVPIDGWYESQLGFGRTVTCADDHVVVGDGSGSFHEIEPLAPEPARWERLPEPPEELSPARPIATGGSIAFLPLQSLSGDPQQALIFDFSPATWRYESKLNRTGEVASTQGRIVGWVFEEPRGEPSGRWFIDVAIDEG